MLIDIKGINLVDRFNKFFGGSAEIKINETLEHLLGYGGTPCPSTEKSQSL